MSAGLAKAVFASPLFAGISDRGNGRVFGASKSDKSATGRPAGRLLKALLMSALLHLAVLASVGQSMPGRLSSVLPAQVLTVSLEADHAVSALKTEEQKRASTTPDLTPKSSPWTDGIGDGTAASRAGRKPFSTRSLLPPLTSAPDLNYFTSDQLDELPRPVNDVLLRYPENAFANGVSGEVRLRLLINEAGRVDKAMILEAQPEQIFDEAALAAARQLRFSPAIREGRVVKSEKNIAIVFDPTSDPVR